MQPGERRRFSGGIARRQYPRRATAACGHAAFLASFHGMSAFFCASRECNTGDEK